METNRSGPSRMSNGSTWTKEQDVRDESTVTPRSKSFAEKIKETFDLDLLKDSTYLNVALGCSFFWVAESNFKLMAPFFLADVGECRS